MRRALGYPLLPSRLPGSPPQCKRLATNTLYIEQSEHLGERKNRCAGNELRLRLDFDVDKRRKLVGWARGSYDEWCPGARRLVDGWDIVRRGSGRSAATAAQHAQLASRICRSLTSCRRGWRGGWI
jgi:hypothetical protein